MKVAWLGMKEHKARVSLSFSGVLSKMDACNDSLFIGFTRKLR